MARKHFMTKSRRNSPHVFLQFSLTGNLLVFLLLNQQNLLASLLCKIQLTRPKVDCPPKIRQRNQVIINPPINPLVLHIHMHKYHQPLMSEKFSSLRKTFLSFWIKKLKKFTEP